MYEFIIIIIIESWNKMSMYKWVHQAIAKCTEENH